MDEPSSSGHNQVQPSELLVQTNIFLVDLDNAQKQRTLNRPKPPRDPPVASFGKRSPQDVRVRRNPTRHVRMPVRPRGHALPPAAPLAPCAPINRPAGSKVQRIRKRFGSSFPEKDWPTMRMILEQCDFPKKHRFKTCGRDDCVPCQATPCTPATIEKCKACKKKWVNNGSKRSRKACTKRV